MRNYATLHEKKLSSLLQVSQASLNTRSLLA